ncbi:sensor histidine kinase [Subtercola lobariae]|uniref:histidine kinase n=1 Tax=Subtercola lobariae TaxID=1588641 RepID=A0A917AZ02_9MICO|nr:sensor histidine kinase [Subtercola lobariae]GGF11586.1 two-component sensor histidine kinase [Subtercola lobariae]
MTRFSWWHVAVGATVLALALVVLPDLADSPGTTIGAWSCLAVLGGGYALFGWRSFTADDPATDEFAAAAGDRRARASALVFPLLAIACTSVGVALNPSMAILQAITFPIIWFSIEPLSRAVVLNVLLAVGVTVGFVVWGGTGLQNVVQSAVIEGISLLFSLALGFWFSFALDKGRENTRLLNELRAAQDELAALNRDSGILSERERLAGEIHDTIAQSLTGLVMVAQRTSTLLPDDLTTARENLGLIEDIARDALVETRALVAASAPVDPAGGLLPALDRLIARFTRETSVAITLDAADYVTQSNEVEVVLLRSAQEALANVRKHSGATTVTMRLSTASDGAVVLTVGDNGSGIDGAEPLDNGFGLTGMQQRLALLGGTLTVGQSAAGGVQLAVTLPGASGTSTAGGVQLAVRVPGLAGTGTQAGGTAVTSAGEFEPGDSASPGDGSPTEVAS